MNEFEYPDQVDLSETTTLKGGTKSLRYGRLLIKDGPDHGKPRADGMLFDRSNPMSPIKPIRSKSSLSQDLNWRGGYYRSSATPLGDVAGGVTHSTLSPH